jgi:hypothetical protein
MQAGGGSAPYQPDSPTYLISFCTGPGCGCHYLGDSGCPTHGFTRRDDTTVTRTVKYSREDPRRYAYPPSY